MSEVDKMKSALEMIRKKVPQSRPISPRAAGFSDPRVFKFPKSQSFVNP